MQTFNTKIGDKTITCEALGVREGMAFQGRFTRVMADGLKSAFGKDIVEIFKEGVELDDGGDQFGASLIMSFISTFAKFRDGADWDDFQSLVIDACEMCQMKTKDYVEPLKVDDLSFVEHEQYKIFFWFVECQLGNFTAWKFVKKYLSQMAGDFLGGGKKPLAESAQT